MIAIIFEILGLVNFGVANYWFYTEKTTPDWMFYMLCSIVFYIVSLKYDRNAEVND